MSEREELLSSVTSYSYGGTSSFNERQSQKSSHLLIEESGEDDNSIGHYPSSDLISVVSAEQHLTVSEIQREVTKAKQGAIATLIATVVFTVLSLVASEESDSSAAFGFAFESLLAGLASFIILWRFWSMKELESRNRRREVIALFAITSSLIISGVSVGYKSIKALVLTEKHKKSKLLLILSAVSVGVYLILFVYKHRIAKRLCSRALRTDAIDALCGALLALSIVVTTSTREFTTKAWFLDSVIALGVAVFSLFYGFYSLVHFVKLYKKYKSWSMEEKKLVHPELYQQVYE
ncbi:transmembrane protein 163-like [Dendronephthya gigantea]|uniref:transmembrane protein 163-like n=1 Tax=Dendronephthya gigantea TaxID=151771 RepID=UPI00106B2D98|nr:transmembrane protein 163-like [Dendronephthya gigantea]